MESMQALEELGIELRRTSNNKLARQGCVFVRIAGVAGRSGESGKGGNGVEGAVVKLEDEPGDGGAGGTSEGFVAS